MNDIARQLRAQIPSSTDPDWLEQMARAAERRTTPARVDTPAPAKRRPVTTLRQADQLSLDLPIAIDSAA